MLTSLNKSAFVSLPIMIWQFHLCLIQLNFGNLFLDRSFFIDSLKIVLVLKILCSSHSGSFNFFCWYASFECCNFFSFMIKHCKEWKEWKPFFDFTRWCCMCFLLWFSNHCHFIGNSLSSFLWLNLFDRFLVNPLFVPGWPASRIFFQPFWTVPPKWTIS